MKVIITSDSSFTSKKGEPWRKLTGITDTGAPVEVFLNKEQIQKFPVSGGAIVNQKQLDDMFQTLPVIEVSFDQNGRFVSLEE